MANILVVEDDPNMIQLLKSILEKDGHILREAYNGQEGLALLGIEPPAPEMELPDLIILDIMLPVMDGFTFHNRLLQEQTLRSIPVIVLTAKGQMKEVFEVSPNVKAYVEKPFDIKRFRELIKKYARP